MGQITAFDLNNFIEKNGIKIYFETGTGECVSLEYALRYSFDKLYSVDIDKDLILSAKNKFSNNDRVELICDLSKNALLSVVPNLDKDKPVLFFLDAHFPGADFHKVSYEQSIREHKKDAFPLEDELRIISSNRDISKDVFVIDDFILYEEGEYESFKAGNLWQYKWLQDELNIQTDSSFIYELFKDSHDCIKDVRHQGYLIITPKN